MPDVVIAGAGPAGWALAVACADRGLSVAVVAPEPLAPWTATYGLWVDQAGAVPALVRASVVTAAGRVLDREYAVVDNAATLAAWSARGVDAVVGRVVGVGGAVVRLDGGRVLRAGVVVDATGYRRALSGGPPPGPRVEQSAVGVVLPAEVAAPVVAPGAAVFMDGWDTAGGVPTFLYAVPLPGGRTLVEETSLAARPAVPADLLRARLDRRLAAAGVDARGATVERVRFPMDVPTRAPNAFGAAAGMVHPATGYSVGAALDAAPAVAAALAAGRPVRSAVWTPRARAVHALRTHGRRALLALPPELLPRFFDLFFALPAHSQRAFLTGREDVTGLLVAMSSLFAAAPWRIRHSLALAREKVVNIS